ncbi:MAG: APC family permease, partial [Patulibacter sp.]|nr:APC family permease [Patulibacter sp.]
DIIVMASLAVIASSYTFLFFGFDKLSSSAAALIIGSIVWIAVMTWVAWRGIELSARTQQALFVVEVIVIVTFSIACFAKAGGHPGHMSPSLEWFNPFGVSFGVLAQGVLLGLFIYWGWDTGVSINEETENSRETPGTAAVLSTVLLLAIYLVVGTATQTYGGTKAIADNPDDVFSFLGPQVLGSWFSHILFLIIVMSSAASTQTTIMPGARQALSMARRKSIPAKFGRIHPKLQTPDYATIFVGVVSAIWTTFLLCVSPGQSVLGDSVTAVGFAICFYYGGTALAGAWFFRRASLEGVRAFVELMVLPLLGGVLMTLIFGYALYEYFNPDNTNSAVLGVGMPVVIGIGFLLLGVPLMLWCMTRYQAFFRGETMPSLESYEQNQEDPSILAALEPDLPHGSSKSDPPPPDAAPELPSAGLEPDAPPASA